MLTPEVDINISFTVLFAEPSRIFTDPVFSTLSEVTLVTLVALVTVIHQRDSLMSTPGCALCVLKHCKNSEQPVNGLVVQSAADPCLRYVVQSGPGPKLVYAPSKPHIEQHALQGWLSTLSRAYDRFLAPGWVRPESAVTASRDLRGIFAGLR